VWELKEGDTTKPRIIFSNGDISYYPTNQMAYQVWLGLPSGTMTAMRTAGDDSPVYPNDCVDRG